MFKRAKSKFPVAIEALDSRIKHKMQRIKDYNDSKQRMADRIDELDKLIHKETAQLVDLRAELAALESET